MRIMKVSCIFNISMMFLLIIFTLNYLMFKLYILDVLVYFISSISFLISYENNHLIYKIINDFPNISQIDKIGFR